MIAAVMNEVLATVAKHYADKIVAEGMAVTNQEVAAAVQNNWPKIAAEAAELYELTINELKGAA